MSTTTQPAPLTIVETLEQYGHEALTAVQHAAMRLVGLVAVSEQNLLKLEASSPFVKQAWDEGVAVATAYGLPVQAIENVGSQVLAAALAFAAPPAPIVVTPPPAA